MEPPRAASRLLPSGPRVVVAVALAWTPLYLLWILFILTYADTATLRGAAFGGLTSVGLAAVLGIGVWWASGKLPWPDRLRPRFYLSHLGLGALYASSWVLVGYLIAALREGVPIGPLIRDSRVVGWQFILALALYGLVAGVSYAIRTRTRLREQERVSARAEALATTARLAALRARVNPHFLFNTLHSLGALVRDDPATDGRAIEDLGELLRYVLDDDGQPTLLDDEWRFTRRYLDLEQLRFGDRFDVRSDIAEGALSRPVPRMTLQPLLENAVLHAVEPSTGPVRIEVTAALDGPDLVLTVVDDGPGAAGPGGGGAGTGLRVLHERLRATCGPDASVDIDGRDGNGFSVRVVIPPATP